LKTIESLKNWQEKKTLRNKRTMTKIKKQNMINLDWKMKLKINQKITKRSMIKITNKKYKDRHSNTHN
jgi:hypothetical protein